ncbi:methyltransferase family protein [Saliphagus infecundisoli]|uniref:Methyltransferase family protein n=1 Tax=Saliphagus infecundisoli TaxID=1849069 RepID=A0ABD5QFL3_9EURY|nr:phosphatidylethanolamine N-methyltransferase family protein [Saliphagus infecundisoli]
MIGDGFASVSLTTAAFAVALVLVVANLSAIVASAVGVADLWPPGERGWYFYAHWGLSQVVNVALFALAIGDWGSLGLPIPVVAAGGILFIGGMAAALAAGYDLGVSETSGLEGDLRTGGWYRYSRNPQYVAYVVATVGFAVVANSVLVAAVCLPLFGWWLALPLAEEPWLREQYGRAYERYAEQTPRFVGRKTFRELAGSRSSV